MKTDETFFDKFWQSSNLDQHNIRQFAESFNSYDSDDKELFLEYPKASRPLSRVASRLNRIAEQRISSRDFSNKTLSAKELSLVFSSFQAVNGLEHRSYPSAGATYAVEVYAVCFNTEDYQDKIIYYDAENHGVVELSHPAPSWAEASKSLNMEVKGVPNLLVAIAIFPERAIVKYGERGGRFALLEAGAAMQQLSLQVAASKKLKGVAVGGMLDEVWRNYLGLENSDGQIGLGYLIGK